MPTNEAKAAAKYLHFHAWMDEDGVLRVSGGTAEAIDRETHLPALLAVAEAAKEYFSAVDEQNRPAQYMKKRKLRAALDKIP